MVLPWRGQTRPLIKQALGSCGAPESSNMTPLSKLCTGPLVTAHCFYCSSGTGFIFAEGGWRGRRSYARAYHRILKLPLPSVFFRELLLTTCLSFCFVFVLRFSRTGIFKDSLYSRGSRWGTNVYLKDLLLKCNVDLSSNSKQQCTLLCMPRK